MNYKLIKKNYEQGLWSARMVHKAVEKGVITEEEYELIINGETAEVPNTSA